MAVNDSMSLADLFKANYVDAGVLEELAGPPWKITTVKQLANSFDSKADIKTTWAAKSTKFKNEGDQISNLIQAWREAEAWTERGTKRAGMGLPEEELDDPLREAVQTTLQEAFKKEYGVSIPATWTCIPGIVGRLHRELNKRSHIPVKLSKVKTLGVISHASKPVKRQKLGFDMEIVVGASHEHEGVHHTFQYTHKLQALLYSMAFAGTYKVQYKNQAGVQKSISLQNFTRHNLVQIRNPRKQNVV